MADSSAGRLPSDNITKLLCEAVESDLMKPSNWAVIERASCMCACLVGLRPEGAIGPNRDRMRRVSADPSARGAAGARVKEWWSDRAR